MLRENFFERWTKSHALADLLLRHGAGRVQLGLRQNASNAHRDVILVILRAMQGIILASAHGLAVRELLRTRQLLEEV